MAGHSKWANIKHKKAKEDAKRGQSFTKLSKEMTVCARSSGGDPEGNPRLRQLIEKARGINMPLDNITRAIKKGTGELPGVQYEAVKFEGSGPGGMAIIVEVLTDNNNRTVADMRHLFNKYNGNLGATGSVAWMFDHLGVIRTTAPKFSEDELLEALIDFEVQDISIEDNMLTITTTIPALLSVKEALEKLNIIVEHAELEWVARTSVELPEEKEQQAYTLLERLEEQEDVQNVYSNLN
jgi:YebC/PmpR family DNA-binding regulatory protein